MGIVAATLLVAACGRAELGPIPPSGDYKLYAATSTSSSQQVSVIDSVSHSIERTLPFGTPSPDWAHLYSVSAGALVDLDPQTGSALHMMLLHGDFQLPSATISGLPGGLSQNGRYLVLEAFDTPGAGIPTATHFLVVDTSYKTAAKRIDLIGDFQFDAVSNNGQRVYMIEYLPVNSYHVRVFDVAAGRLDPTIIVDKSDGSAAMTGLRLAGVASPDSQWLYSVYIREKQGAFIHALSLDGNIAFCLDLPGPGYASSADGFRWSLALSADGSRLYAANGGLGVIAEFDTSNGAPSVLRIVHIDTPQPSAGLLVPDVQAKGFGGDGAVLSPDGRTLVISGATGVTWIDTAKLQVIGRQLAGWTVLSLALSPNGNNLYVINDSGMIAEMSMTGAHEASTFAGGPGQPMALIRVQAAQAP